MPRISLSVKLLVAFALVVVVAASVMAALSRRSAAREFIRFIEGNQMEVPDSVVLQLADLYAQQGDWSGAEEVLKQISLPVRDQEIPIPLFLVDTQGNVVASNWMELVSSQLLEPQLSEGWPVQVDGETVGTLIAPGRALRSPEALPRWLDPEGEAVVGRVQRAILIAGLSAGGLALVIAGLLAWGLVRPLRGLTAAAEGIARGDLSQRVPIASKDEVGELAATFNRMATALERAEELRRNMTADVAHELRTPLSVIRGRLEGVLDGVYPATPEHLQPILEAIELLTYLVEDLRLLAQAEAGQLSLQKRAVDVGDLLRDAQVNFEPQATDKGVTLGLDLPPGLPEVMADWHRVVQVLSNLLVNALRHTPEGGRVTLSATSLAPSGGGKQGAVKLTVADTGAGIPADDLPYVFDRFWRGEKSRSRAGGGSGLGLAIARQLVELHGGMMGVESTPGKGAEFWFTLPAA
jgi:signal transduction histidine kinase